MGGSAGLLRADPDPARAGRSWRCGRALHHGALADRKGRWIAWAGSACRRSRCARGRCSRGARAARGPFRRLGTCPARPRAGGEGAGMNATTADAPRVSRYQPVDRLYLWSLLEPARPVPAAELNLVRSNQGVSLRYLPVWRERGFELSEDLPLIDQEFLPLERNTAAGAVDDARPD